MQSGTLISVREYLITSYRPDRDYLEGVVLERNVGEHDHSRTQYLLSVYFGSREKQWRIRGYTEQRVQVKRERFRIPDVCFVTADTPVEPIFTRPPLLCVEILSKDDRMSEMQDRINDYLTFGVRTVWVIDPTTRRAWSYTADAMREVKDGILRAEPEIVVPLAEVLPE
ncbi:MAG: Uma2 family endonuclease [Terriglobia bacterium]